LVSAARDTSQGVFAMRLGTHEAPGAVQQVNTLPQTSPPDPVVGSAGYHSAAVAWQQNPGTSGSPEIRVRYFEAGTFVPEQVVSRASGGPTDAASGLAVAGDIAADVAVAWVQGTGGAKSIVAAQLYQPPGGLAPADRFQYVRSSSQQLSWTPARGTWGPLTYTVTIDGRQVAKTTGTSTPVPLPLAQGRHTWQVTAANPAGQTSSSRQATIFIDSVAPTATTTLRGKRVAGSPLHLKVHAHDPSPSSGIKTVRIKWGGGSAPQSGRSQSHTYAVAGRYKITVIVTDQAGNRTTVTLRIGIARAKARGRRGHH
jgi:PKD domain